MLTDVKIRQANATGKNYMLNDSDGLSLFVSYGGSKLWHYRYTWLGKRTRISLGSYPAVSLKDARELRDQARSLVAKHINPRIERKQKLNAIKMAGENTFIAVYEKWLSHRSLTLEAGRQTSLSIIPRAFQKDVFPSLKRLTIYDVRCAAYENVLGVAHFPLYEIAHGIHAGNRRKPIQ